jgi:hypothetical protein
MEGGCIILAARWQHGILHQGGVMKKTLQLLFLFSAVSVSMSAASITVGAGWYGFCVGGPGSPATQGCQNEGIGETGNPTTFSSTSPMLFRITDAVDHGDTFDVSGDFVLSTPDVPIEVGGTFNPDLAWLDPGYSKGSILLAPGSYSVNVFARDSPFGAAAGYLRVDAVPEPATWILVGGSFVLLVIRRIRST